MKWRPKQNAESVSDGDIPVVVLDGHADEVLGRVVVVLHGREVSAAVAMRPLGILELRVAVELLTTLELVLEQPRHRLVHQPL